MIPYGFLGNINNIIFCLIAPKALLIQGLFIYLKFLYKPKGLNYEWFPTITMNDSDMFKRLNHGDKREGDIFNMLKDY